MWYLQFFHPSNNFIFTYSDKVKVIVFFLFFIKEFKIIVLFISSDSINIYQYSHRIYQVRFIVHAVAWIHSAGNLHHSNPPLINKNHYESLTNSRYHKNINVNKVHCPDNISGRMLQLCGDNITLPLNIIFTNIINTGIFPSLWKSENVTPTHKKDSKQFVNNYRPLSLLPLFSKIFERRCTTISSQIFL